MYLHPLLQIVCIVERLSLGLKQKTKNKKGMQEAAVNHEFKKQQLHYKNEHWDQNLTQGNHSHW